MQCKYVKLVGGRCHREALTNSEKGFCLLHEDWDYKSEEETKKEFYREIEEGISDFEGCILPEIDLSRRKFERGFNFRNVTIKGYVDFEGAIIEGGVLFWHATIVGDTTDGFVVFNKAIIKGNTDFRGATIYGDIAFSGATIEKEALFAGVTVYGDVWFDDATMLEDVLFNGATIVRPFKDLEEGGNVKFNGAIIKGKCSFNNTTIEDYAVFTGAIIERSAEFVGTTINGATSFDGATINGTILFNEATIKGYASFKKATIKYDAYFEGATIEGYTYFNEATIGRSADLDMLNTPYLTFENATFHDKRGQEKACRTARITQERIGDRILADYHFYREMEAKRKQKYLKFSLKPLLKLIRKLRLEKLVGKHIKFLERERRIYWGFLELPVQYIFGYGVHPWRVIATWLLTVFSLAFVYWLGNGVEAAESLVEYIYFSVVTAATPGYGGYHPKPGFYQGLASFEAIFGTFMWAAFIATFARKYMR